eukprot:NODE_1033_length_1751_cov_30.330200_g911_i0.p1 GENE.NODE_1033_length_1751_cov_30.330200_g911_i0~~NODE_1033_length_1751_cov_30.330200_g911_i0.p1  ORF type:complete len:452 (+),score=34.46 NODE_1033_length_1751_cov_30.330200_g911_i0:166-1521(+)
MISVRGGLLAVAFTVLLSYYLVGFLRAPVPPPAATAAAVTARRAAAPAPAQFPPHRWFEKISNDQAGFVAEAPQRERPSLVGPGKLFRRNATLVVVRYPLGIPSAWLHPNYFPCSVPCSVHYGEPWHQAYWKARSLLSSQTVVVLYSAMPFSQPDREWYDIERNPLGVRFMMVNWENWHRNDIVSSQWKSHWWLRRLVEDPTAWRNFSIVSSTERFSMVQFNYYQQYRLHLGDLRRFQSPKRTDALVSVLASHSGYGFDRLLFVKSLMKHVRIHSYGRLLRNRQAPNNSHWDVHRAIEIVSRYHFHLALENSIYPDYVTEKVYLALFAGTVPVYVGAPNVGEYVPQQSVIVASHFSSLRALAAYLRCIAANPQLYAQYLRWNDSHTEQSPEWSRWSNAAHPLCRTCELVYHNDSRLYNESVRTPTAAAANESRTRELQQPFPECVTRGMLR